MYADTPGPSYSERALIADRTELAHLCYKLFEEAALEAMRMVQGGTIGQPLAGRKVLVVEDEYLIADDLAAMLQEAGAEVIGPAASLPHAVRLTEHQQSLDAAVLDINLRGVEVFPLANELKSAGIPIIFLTGYGDNNIPEEFSHYGRCEKPMGTPHVITELAALLRSEPASA